MKTENSLLAAFLLNLACAVLECVGGIVTGSVAILSDALHDLGDAVSIGASYVLEKKSKRPPDEVYTYGYGRYSVLGSVITTLILLSGSLAVAGNAVHRILHPTQIRYDGMMVFAVIGVCVNLGGALFTRKGESLNQKAVNLHLLEDVLGWVVVLVGAIVMQFTDFALLDPLMSIGVAGFIFANALGNLKEVLALFLEKAPRGVDTEEIRAHISRIDGVLDVHHIHLWSMDGQSRCATMHIVTDAPPAAVKEAVREELRAHGICHVTLETETADEHCPEPQCRVEPAGHASCHHHHH